MPATQGSSGGFNRKSTAAAHDRSRKADSRSHRLLTRRLASEGGTTRSRSELPDVIPSPGLARPGDVPLLEALTDAPAEFAALIGSAIPHGWPEFPEAIAFTLAHLQESPEADRSWSMQFFMDPATGRLIGSGGFASPPVARTVEIGYEVAPEFRGQGLGAAAARALVARAVATGEVDHVIAHTLPGPNPSTGVLVSLGFEHVDELEDPEAGPIWGWRWTRTPDA